MNDKLNGVRQPVPFGKYLLLDRVSVGGMAEVFKAKSFGVEGFEKIIAIKRILPSMCEDQDFIKMFIDEAKIAGQLSHSNICQIYELGRAQGAHFIAMEYIWGKDLLQIQQRLSKQKKQMSVAMACHIVSKICEGLHYAHRKKDALGSPLKIVHRDCSPQNVLVSYEGEVKIIDFGIARAASRSAQTHAGVLKGKFGYMSPEQVRGMPLDHRSDIFAVGTMLYESLTGARLFFGESDFSTLEKVRNADVATPRSLNDQVPAHVEDIVMKALARDPGDRYQWCGELHVDLQKYLGGQEKVFTTKTLSGWIKDGFRGDLEREQGQLENYRGMGKGGLIAGVPQAKAKLDVVEELGVAEAAIDQPTQLGGPSFEGGGFSAANAGGADDDEYEGEIDERPTEVLTEALEAELAKVRAEVTAAESLEGANGAQLPDVSLSPLSGISAALQGAVVAQRPPLTGGIGAGWPELGTPPSNVGPGAREPGHQAVSPRPSSPPKPEMEQPASLYPRASTSDGSEGGVRAQPAPVSRVPSPASFLRGRSKAQLGVGAAGVAAAALVALAIANLSPKPAPAVAEARLGTLSVLVSGTDSAQVLIDGQAVGTSGGSKGLSLQLPPQKYQFKATVPGKETCGKEVAVAAGEVQIVRCDFSEKAEAVVQ